MTDIVCQRNDKLASGDIENGKVVVNKKSPSKYQRQPDIIEQCAQAYIENPRPRRLGKLFVFWYNSQNEPRIVVGPDFYFSILELVLVNGILGLILASANNTNPIIFWSGLSILLFHDFAFLATICKNQGLPPRNPNYHSKGYLNKVKTVDHTKYCRTCKTIARKDVYTEHCSFCEYCVEELDHHCPWSSKCIGKGNMLPFKLFIAGITASFIFAFVGGGAVVGSNMHHEKVKHKNSTKNHLL